jgi:hypothetical protein
MLKNFWFALDGRVEENKSHVTRRLLQVGKLLFVIAIVAVS